MVHWGTNCWRFFHAYAHHISNERFLKIKSTFIDIFTKTMSCLPCPLCKNHALAYLRRRPLSRIRNKQELRKYLWEFHNSVNARNSKPTFSYESLSVYSRINVKRAFQPFIQSLRTSSMLSVSNSMIYNIVYRGWIFLI
jgi:uncharacterized protein YbaR (Trm112 family)